MIEEGEDAPTFTLLAASGGEIEETTLSEHLEDQVVILAFYPGDFNPGCDGTSTKLDELDLFTMQKDVSILALSGDSIYSHQAFADEYDLHIPLLSDPHGEVAEAYDAAVEVDDAGHLTKRAAVVIDHTGTVEYTWEATELTQAPPVDAIRTAVQNVGDDDSAFARYRVGHAHYVEGRRAFTSAMEAYEDKEWMMANGDFDAASDEFSKAEEEFNTAARFAEDETLQGYYERAERKAEALWRAAGWLSDSASAYASGEGGTAISLREDAESPLENAGEISDPVPPDEFPPEDADAETATESEPVGLSLDVEEPAAGTDGSTADAPEADEIEFGGDAADGTGAAGGAEEPAAAAGDGPATDPKKTQPDDDIDDEELEEIAAEIEEQTEAARETAPDSDNSSIVPNSIDVDGEEPADAPVDDASGPADDEHDDGEIDLDLTDPTEGDEAEDDEDEELNTEGLGGGGDHGVPDSL